MQDIVIIGAGQAGLAAGYHLQRAGLPFTIFDQADHIGANWTGRWDSLRLFTPVRYSSLPGLPFPGEPYHLPGKDEVAAYLQQYARHFDLPVQLNTRVEHIYRDGAGYEIVTDGGIRHAEHVILAIGAFQQPAIPSFAQQLDPAITQMHSSDYRNPLQISPGPVLIVGAGASGAQIALDLAPSHPITLSGRDVGSAPRAILGRDVYWWVDLIKIDNVPRDGLLGDWMYWWLYGRGGSRVGLPMSRVKQAGVSHRPRVARIENGAPVLEDGTRVDVQTVIWATGYRPDYHWFANLPTGPNGYPQHERGIVHDEAGVYVLGLPYLHWPDSHLLKGVGRDAAYIVQRIQQRIETRQPMTA